MPRKTVANGHHKLADHSRTDLTQPNGYKVGKDFAEKKEFWIFQFRTVARRSFHK